jgi:hypothetical protein
MAITHEQAKIALIEFGHTERDAREYVGSQMRARNDLAEARQKLHDKFVMAAITGLLASNSIGAAGAVVESANLVADNAMKYREKGAAKS